MREADGIETASEYRTDTVTNHRWGLALFVAILGGLARFF